MEEHSHDTQQYEDLSKRLDELEKKIEVLRQEESKLNKELFTLRDNQESKEYKDLAHRHNRVAAQLDTLLLEKRDVSEELNERVRKESSFQKLEASELGSKGKSDKASNNKIPSGKPILDKPSADKSNSPLGSALDALDKTNSMLKEQYRDFMTEHEHKEKVIVTLAATKFIGDAKIGTKAVIESAKASVKSGVENASKQLAQKINPLEKKINKSDVTDTGMESMRFGYQSAKESVNAVKTIVSTPKKVKAAAKTSVRTVKTTVKTVKTTVKVAYTAVNFIGTVWEHAIAATLNPILWTIIFAVVMVIYGAFFSYLYTQGTTEATYDAYVSAKGLGKVDDEYAHGQELYKAAELAKKTEFGEMIIGSGEMEVFIGAHGIPYYIYRNSDLVSVTKTYAEPSGAYMTANSGVCWATPEAKNALLGYWNMSVEEYQALAIAYTYIQKQENIKNETVMDIYDVLFTEELMNTIIDYSVSFTESVYTNCTCPGCDCAYSDDRGHYCPHHHTLHSIAITFYSKDDVMDKMGFTEKEKEWERVTEDFFKKKYYGAPVPEAGG